MIDKKFFRSDKNDDNSRSQNRFIVKRTEKAMSDDWSQGETSEKHYSSELFNKIINE